MNAIEALNKPRWDDHDWSPLPPLTRDADAEVCVVGLGGTGLSCISEALKLGAKSVIGIDAVDIAAGAAGRNGGLLLAEKLLNPRKDGPATNQLQSLNMLICTEGRERTAAEYEALLCEAGFREVRTAKTGGAVDAVLAVK